MGELAEDFALMKKIKTEERAKRDSYWGFLS